MRDIPHEARAEFRAHLEEQMIDTFRRQVQFAPTERRARTRLLGRVAAIAAAIVVVLGAGLVWGVRSGFAEARAQVASHPEARAALRALEEPPVSRAITSLACPAVPQQSAGVPILDLPAGTRSRDRLTAVLGMHALSDGRVLVNDAGSRQVRLFDSTLTGSTVVRDSVPGTQNSYGNIQVALSPFTGDSSLMVDFSSRSFLVLGPDGRVGRVMALPNPLDLQAFQTGFARFDQAGRLVYRGPTKPPPPGSPPGTPLADSVPILRTALDSRRLDTLAHVRERDGGKVSLAQDESGGTIIRLVLNPLPLLDDWAMTSDGSIALVRGHDYHIDWISTDGSLHSTKKLPFDFRPLSDSEKQVLVDSARAALEAEGAARRAAAPALRAAAIGRGGGGGGAAPTGPKTREILEFVPLKEIVDYYPAVRRGTSLADADGNVWLLPTSSAQSRHGELVYDVTSVRGGLIRVRVPEGRSVVGFGPGGIVYMLAGDKASGFTLERSRIPGGALKPK